MLTGMLTCMDPDNAGEFGNDMLALCAEAPETFAAQRVRAVLLSAEYAHFESRTRQMITWIASSQRTVRAANFPSARLSGDEVGARIAWRALSLSGSAGWLDARQDDRASIYFGKRLPQRPAFQGYARLEARRGEWTAAADLLEIGEDYLDPINFRLSPSRTLAGLSLSRSWGPLRLTVEGKNLGDRRAQDVGGYPLPGRSFFASCEWSRARPDAHPRSNRSGT